MAIFFHNRFDKNSVQMLSNLPPDTEVIDVFGGDKIPDGYRLTILPLLVDKKIEPVGALRLSCPGGIITFRAIYEDGAPYSGEVGFHININGNTAYDTLRNGVLEIEVEATEPCVLDVEIINDTDGFHPWRGTIEVVQEEG